MRSQFGQAPERSPASVPLSPGTVGAAAVPSSRDIPYDYVATFLLTGQPGNRVQDVINVSVEGAFVAASIGYSFIPPPRDDIPVINGVTGLELYLPLLARSLLVRFIGIEFKYSIVDSGTGRELQNRPIHSIAGLGESTGDRPFRPLAKPMLFLPRSTIRIEVEEISGPADLFGGAQLYMVFHGYKMLGYGTALP